MREKEQENIFEEPQIVWYGVTSLFQFAQKYAASLRAYGNVCGDDDPHNVYLQNSHEAIWRQLLSEISKIYDADKTLGYSNCSMKKLKVSCVADSKIFPAGNEDELIKCIDGLYARYEELLSKNLRNKKLAHYDLESAFSMEAPTIPFNAIEMFINDTESCLSAIGERLIGATLQDAYFKMVETHERDLRALVNKSAE